MRLPNLENFKNANEIDVRRVTEVPTVEQNVVIMSDKDKLNVINQIERAVRSSSEYRQYVAFLKKEIDMTQCAFFHNVNNKDGKKVSIEIHHEPFTLFDITKIVLESWQTQMKKVNILKIAEEVMQLHYQNKVGLIPLSLTVHELVHSGKILIPLQNVYGDFVSFLEEYDHYITEDLRDTLEKKFTMSKDVAAQDTSILEKRFVYLEVDGFNFPQLLEE